MPRKAQFPPKLHLSRGRARCKWLGRWWDCGKAGTPEAERKYRRLLLGWQDDPTAAPVDPEAYTVAELCRDYRAAQPFAAGELVQVRRAMALLLDLYADTPVGEFGPAALGAWQAELGRRNLTRTYVAKLIRIVRSIFRWGVATERVDVGQWQALATVKGLRMGSGRESRVVTAASDADLSKVLPQLPPAARALVQVLRLTGARPSELYALRPADIDRSRPVWFYTPTRHKTAGRGCDRIIYFGPKAREILLSRELSGDAADGYFIHRRGGSYTRFSLRDALERACKRAGVPKISSYRLRHARLTEVANAVGPRASAAVGGHGLKVNEVYTRAKAALAAKVAAETG